MKYLIVGRSGSGKSYLANKMENTGFFKTLKSYTTRPKRDENDNDHTFITKDDIKKYEDDIIARTNINGYDYFSTMTQLIEDDVYLIDPQGLIDLVDTLEKNKDKFRGQLFTVVYVKADDDEKRKEFLKARSSIDKKEMEKRLASEDEQFTEFEKFLRKEDYDNSSYDFESIASSEKIMQISEVINDYDESLFDFATSLLVLAVRRKVLFDAIIKAAKQGTIKLAAADDENKEILIAMKNDRRSDNHPEEFIYLPVEVFVELNIATSDQLTGTLMEIASNMHIISRLPK